MRLGIFDDDPFHAIDFDHFAPGGAGGGLAAGLVLGVLQIDNFFARPPFVLLEDKRPGADVVIDLPVGRRSRHPLGHNEGYITAGFPQRFQHQAPWGFESDPEGLGVNGFDLVDHAHEFLTHDVALAPAL